MSENIDFLKDRVQQVNLKRRFKNDYQRIDKLLLEAQELVEFEREKLNGHEHFRKREIEEEIISIIQEKSKKDILLIQNHDGQNLGMRGVYLGLHNLVMIALDNEKASLQTDIRGLNLGQCCVDADFEEGVIKALDNIEASTYTNPYSYSDRQINDFIPILALKKGMKKAVLKALDNNDLATFTNAMGENLGMLCATAGFEEGVLKALDNPVASLQQTRYGENLGMYAVEYKMIKCVEKALQNHEASVQQDRCGRNLGMYCAENCLEDLVIIALDNKEASLQRNYSNRNIGMISAINHLEKATLKALDNPEASLQEDRDGDNIGMLSAMYKLKSCVEKAILNKDSLYNQNNLGENIGMYCIYSDFEDIVLTLLDDNLLSLQQDRHGKNMGMYCAEKKLEKATLKALDNPEARLQVDGMGKNIGHYCLDFYNPKEMKDCVLKALQYPELTTVQDKCCFFSNNWNMGMKCACYGLEDFTIIALENEVARNQKDKFGNTIINYCIAKKLERAIEKYNELCGTNLTLDSKIMEVENAIDESENVEKIGIDNVDEIMLSDLNNVIEIQSDLNENNLDVSEM